MNIAPQPIYGKLCSLYYDIKEQYAKESEVDFYASFIAPNHRILEAMSGSGRLQIPLLQRGYQVDGVDNSPSMLARCRQRCAQFNLTPDLYEQNLEQLSLAHLYQTVIITLGSFQLIADKKRALTTLYKLHDHMQDNANLLLDMFIPDSATHNIRTTDIARIDDHQLIHFSTRHLFHATEQRVEALCSYERVVDGIIHEREEEIMEFVWYSEDELIQLLHHAGFTTIAIHEKPFRASGMSRIVHALRGSSRQG